eukprot:TRINITY_DN2413_c0_g3_i1.p1 TRINITY_DN2413_c0_g3~~TRINITY_DN2413_c0_g3_i1.p1  ORF type:complete len:711 (-),score=192.50 TRINITY_DN2413_c0_g3_i1:164-2296(-)
MPRHALSLTIPEKEHLFTQLDLPVSVQGMSTFEGAYQDLLPQVRVTVGAPASTPKDFYYTICFGSVENKKWKLHLKAEEYLTNTFQVDNLLGADEHPWTCNINYFHDKELLSSSTVDMIRDLKLSKKGDRETVTLQVCCKDLKIEFVALTEPQFPLLCPNLAGINTTEDKAIVLKTFPELSISVYQAIGLTFNKYSSVMCHVTLHSYVMDKSKGWRPTSKTVLKTTAVKSRNPFWGTVVGPFVLTTIKDTLKVEVYNHDNPSDEHFSVSFNIATLAAISTLEPTKHWCDLESGVGNVKAGKIGLGFTAHTMLTLVNELPDPVITEDIKPRVFKKSSSRVLDLKGAFFSKEEKPFLSKTARDDGRQSLTRSKTVGAICTNNTSERGREGRERGERERGEREGREREGEREREGSERGSERGRSEREGTETPETPGSKRMTPVRERLMESERGLYRSQKWERRSEDFRSQVEKKERCKETPKSPRRRKCNEEGEEKKEEKNGERLARPKSSKKEKRGSDGERRKETEYVEDRKEKSRRSLGRSKDGERKEGPTLDERRKEIPRSSSMNDLKVQIPTKNRGRTVKRSPEKMNKKSTRSFRSDEMLIEGRVNEEEEEEELELETCAMCNSIFPKTYTKKLKFRYFCIDCFTQLEITQQQQEQQQEQEKEKEENKNIDGEKIQEEQEEIERVVVDWIRKNNTSPYVLRSPRRVEK